MEAECSSKAQRLSSNTLNTLPQTIIESILCLLPIEEAARTSILSRDWRYKWTKIPKLVFRYDTVYERPTETEQISYMTRARKNMDGRCQLFYAIHQVLLLRQVPIHEFTLVLDADCHCFEIDQILLHLSRNHAVKELTLDLNCTEFDKDWYKLPLCAFSLHQLTDLDLNYCDIDHQPATFGGFVNLRSLCLKDETISTKALLHLLSNSPSIKSFTFFTEAEYIGNEYCTLIRLFECLPVIEHLTTSDLILSWLVLDAVPEEHPTSPVHLKYLCFKDLSFSYDGSASTPLAALIKCCPNLEKIKLVVSLLYHSHVNDCTAILKEMYSDVWLEHLKELEIEDLGNEKSEMEFVKIILARSPKLKKVRIRLSYQVHMDLEVKMLKDLLRAPCASQVDIFVKCPHGQHQ
ncbi:F-box/FBD/LRR-repeat protein At1g13570-like [Bidens hawaiensis]|uniref:F-box/FBD/LRR-repeat protein At1g13570-like n=1 Tax=Bidens hawaiensis TaxID=980011 RepID=UPI004048F8AE